MNRARKENAAKTDIYLDTIDSTVGHVHTLVSLRADQTIARVAQILERECTTSKGLNVLCTSQILGQSYTEGDAKQVNRREGITGIFTGAEDA